MKKPTRRKNPNTVGFSCDIDRKLNVKLLAKIAQTNDKLFAAGEPPISKSIIVRAALMRFLKTGEW